MAGNQVKVAPNALASSMTVKVSSGWRSSVLPGVICSAMNRMELTWDSAEGVQPGVDGTQLFRILSADILSVTVCLIRS